MNIKMLHIDNEILIFNVEGEHYKTIGKLMDYTTDYKERIKQMKLEIKEINHKKYLIKTKDPFDSVMELGKNIGIPDEENIVYIGEI